MAPDGSRKKSGRKLTTMTRTTKIWTTAGCCLAAVVLLAAGLLAWSWAKDSAPRLAEVKVGASSEIHVGDQVAVTAIVECPWYRLPAAEMDTSAPDGMQFLRSGGRRLRGAGWLTWKWACTSVLQATEIGRHENGTMTLSFSSGRHGAGEPVKAVIPPVLVTPRPLAENATLSVAGEVKKSWLPARLVWWQWLALGLVAAMVLAAVLLLFLKPRTRQRAEEAPRVPSWETARLALAVLAADLPSLTPEPFFVRFTDIVRRYCEERFLIRATESTTEEFLEEVRRNESLSPERRQALAAVFGLADEIKFAKGDASCEQLENALASAGRFVTETIPPALPKAN